MTAMRRGRRWSWVPLGALGLLLGGTARAGDPCKAKATPGERAGCYEAALASGAPAHVRISLAAAYREMGERTKAVETLRAALPALPGDAKKDAQAMLDAMAAPAPDRGETPIARDKKRMRTPPGRGRARRRPSRPQHGR